MKQVNAIKALPQLLELWEAIKWEQNRGWDFTPRTEEAIANLRNALSGKKKLNKTPNKIVENPLTGTCCMTSYSITPTPKDTCDSN